MSYTARCPRPFDSVACTSISAKAALNQTLQTLPACMHPHPQDRARLLSLAANTLLGQLHVVDPARKILVSHVYEVHHLLRTQLNARVLNSCS